MTNPYYDSYIVLSKVFSEGAFLKQALTDTFIEEKNRPHTTKICYGVLERNITLEYYLLKLCDKRPKQSIRTILKIAMYAIKYLETAPYAVCNNAVELVKKLGKGANGGFVNAILRKFLNVKIDLPTDKYERLSIEYSYPVFAVKKLIKDYGEERAKSIMCFGKERTAVRFNTNINGEKYLTERRWNYEVTPFANAYFVNGFKRDADFDKGIYTFQSIGSMAICDIVDKGEKLLDACSAPGGKAVLLSDKFNEITAFELHDHRVQLINEYAKRMKKNNITAICKDASVIDNNYVEQFDTVLCDCPCSGYGVVKDNPDILLTRTEEDCNNLTVIQTEILNTCSNYVKVGGYLVYSTCSVFKSEDVDVARKFLAEHDNYIEVTIDSKLKYEKHGEGINFFPDISEGAGFYVCKFKRLK